MVKLQEVSGNPSLAVTGLILTHFRAKTKVGDLGGIVTERGGLGGHQTPGTAFGKTINPTLVRGGYVIHRLTAG